MSLTDEQKATVGTWVSEGLKLSDIQSRINQEFEVSLTYMDVRFLVDDLGLELKDQPKPVDSDLSRTAEATPSAFEPAPEADLGGSASGLEDDGVSVSLHRLYKPGSVVSGEVVFSDGTKAEWSLDQIGRLALNPTTDGYQPSENDLQDFQKKLSILLQNQGF